MRQRHRGIEWLRGGSILYIVAFWHLLGYVDGIDGYKNFVTYRLTVVVLGLFTLMAGILAGRRPIRGAREICRYYKARALRILPPYLIALLLFHLTGMLRWSDVVQGALLQPAFNDHPLRTLWYVNMLIVFYVLVPLLQMLQRRLRRGRWRHWSSDLLLASFLTGGWMLFPSLHHGVDPRLAIYFPAFGTGVLMANRLLGEAGVSGTSASRPELAGLAPLALVAVALTARLPGQAIETSLWSLPMATVVPLVVLIVVERLLRDRTIPAWLQATSHASYCMYLLHRPILREVNPMVQGLAPGHPSLQLVLLWGLAIPLIVAVSWWAQRLYDRSLRAVTV
jgi:peptidoglycan/LPS O-acetylase OafA/YrhL